MTESEIHDSISNDIRKMFQIIEICESSKDGRAVSLDMKNGITELCILKLYKLMKVYACDLKPAKASELISVIEDHKAIVKLLKNENSLPRNDQYERLLIKFKEIEWLNIPIEKLNFKE